MIGMRILTVNSPNKTRIRVLFDDFFITMNIPPNQPGGVLNI